MHAILVKNQKLYLISVHVIVYDVQYFSVVNCKEKPTSRREKKLIEYKAKF